MDMQRAQDKTMVRLKRFQDMQQNHRIDAAGQRGNQDFPR
jgi:hypothetical protein